MKLYRCAHCGTLAHPAHLLCHSCRATEFEEAEVGEGTLLTYTVIHVPPPGVEPPLKIGIVEFDSGVRVLGQLAEDVEVGAKVRGEWTVVRRVEGRDFEGVRFRRSRPD